MRTPPTPDDLARLYDDLGRFCWFLRRLGRKPAGEGLEMHKRLLDPKEEGRPAAGSHGLNSWLFERAGIADANSVVDLGCGFGATLLSFAARREIHGLGLSSSRYQIGRAREQAKALGFEGRLRFEHQSNDSKIPGQHDRALSVETVFHSPDLVHTFRNLAGSLAPGARFTLVEDMAVDSTVEATPAGSALRELWASERLHSIEAFESALEKVGFRISETVDLSDQVPARDGASLDRSRRSIERWRRILPRRGWKRIADAFLGGFELERLYGEKRMRYRCLVCEFIGS